MVENDIIFLGYRLVGDVNFAEASKVASHITPVPGGVGPMTVAQLMSNVVKAAKRQLKSNKSWDLSYLPISPLPKVCPKLESPRYNGIWINI